LNRRAQRLAERLGVPPRAAEFTAASCAPMWLRGAVALVLSCLVTAAGPATAADPSSVLTEIQSIYLERCGGCHGIQGHSAPREVPILRGRVGYFLCLPEARAYLVRLPSLASSPLSDDTLAELMNFVVFDLGHRPGDRNTYPLFTAQEVGELRKRPLNNVSLARYRGALVSELIGRCGAPESLREYSGPEGD
jgi:cytochrome c553